MVYIRHELAAPDVITTGQLDTMWATPYPAAEHPDTAWRRYIERGAAQIPAEEVATTADHIAFLHLLDYVNQQADLPIATPAEYRTGGTHEAMAVIAQMALPSQSTMEAVRLTDPQTPKIGRAQVVSAEVSATPADTSLAAAPEAARVPVAEAASADADFLPATDAAADLAATWKDTDKAVEQKRAGRIRRLVTSLGAASITAGMVIIAEAADWTHFFQR